MSKKRKNPLHSTYKGEFIWRPTWPRGWWTAGINLRADTLAGIRQLITDRQPKKGGR